MDTNVCSSGTSQENQKKLWRNLLASDEEVCDMRVADLDSTYVSYVDNILVIVAGTIRQTLGYTRCYNIFYC